MSKITKHYRRLKNIFLIVLIILSMAPLGVAFGLAISEGEIAMKTKLTIGVVFACVLMLTVINWVTRWHWRTPWWILIFVILFICKSKTLNISLIVMGSCTMADEIIFTPLYRHFKDKFKFNKNYDKRQYADEKIERDEKYESGDKRSD